MSIRISLEEFGGGTYAEHMKISLFSLKKDFYMNNMVRKNSVTKVSTVRTSTPLTKEPFQCRVNSSRPVTPKTPPVQSRFCLQTLRLWSE